VQQKQKAKVGPRSRERSESANVANECIYFYDYSGRARIVSVVGGRGGWLLLFDAAGAFVDGAAAASDKRRLIYGA
jgi:hypothetical protein